MNTADAHAWQIKFLKDMSELSIVALLDISSKLHSDARLGIPNNVIEALCRRNVLYDIFRILCPRADKYRQKMFTKHMQQYRII